MLTLKSSQLDYLSNLTSSLTMYLQPKLIVYHLAAATSMSMTNVIIMKRVILIILVHCSTAKISLDPTTMGNYLSQRIHLQMIRLSTLLEI